MTYAKYKANLDISFAELEKNIKLLKKYILCEDWSSAEDVEIRIKSQMFGIVAQNKFCRKVMKL